MDRLETFMRKRRRLNEYQEDDFRIRNNAEMRATLSETTRTMSLLLGSVAALSLIVGGIMNIMLSRSTSARTR